MTVQLINTAAYSDIDFGEELVISNPPEAQADDLAVLWVTFRGNVSPVTPAGWTEHVSHLPGSDTTPGAVLYSRVGGASSVTVEMSGGAPIAASYAIARSDSGQYQIDFGVPTLTVAGSVADASYVESEYFPNTNIVAPALLLGLLGGRWAGAASNFNSVSEGSLVAQSNSDWVGTAFTTWSSLDQKVSGVSFDCDFAAVVVVVAGIYDPEVQVDVPHDIHEPLDCKIIQEFRGRVSADFASTGDYWWGDGDAYWAWGLSDGERILVDGGEYAERKFPPDGAAYEGLTLYRLRDDLKLWTPNEPWDKHDLDMEVLEHGYITYTPDESGFTPQNTFLERGIIDPETEDFYFYPRHADLGESRWYHSSPDHTHPVPISDPIHYNDLGGERLAWSTTAKAAFEYRYPSSGMEGPKGVWRWDFDGDNFVTPYPVIYPRDEWHNHFEQNLIATPDGAIWFTERDTNGPLSFLCRYDPVEDHLTERSDAELHDFDFGYNDGPFLAGGIHEPNNILHWIVNPRDPDVSDPAEVEGEYRWNNPYRWREWTYNSEHDIIYQIGYAENWLVADNELLEDKFPAKYFLPPQYQDDSDALETLQDPPGDYNEYQGWGNGSYTLHNIQTGIYGWGGVNGVVDEAHGGYGQEALDDFVPYDGTLYVQGWSQGVYTWRCIGEGSPWLVGSVGWQSGS